MSFSSPAFAQSYASHFAEAQRARAEPQTDPRLEIYQALLFGSISVDFDRTPVRDVFDSLAEDLDINIVVRYRDDRNESGIDPRLPIRLRLRGMLPLDVLELILEECSADEPSTWQARDGFLEIGSKQRLSIQSARERRTYPVDDLIFSVPRFDDAPSVGFDTGDRLTRSRGGGRRSGARSPRATDELVDLITSTIVPDAWPQNGGSWATIVTRGGTLIVDAPPFIHRKLGGTPRIPPPGPATSRRSSSPTTPSPPPGRP